MSTPGRDRLRSRHGPDGSAMPASEARMTRGDRVKARDRALDSLRVRIRSARTITKLNDTYSRLLRSLDNTLPLIGLQMTMSAPEWKAQAGSALKVAYKEAYSHIGPPLADRLADELGQAVENAFGRTQHHNIPESEYVSLLDGLLGQLKRREKELVPHSDFRNDLQLNEIHAAMKGELDCVFSIEDGIDSDDDTDSDSDNEQYAPIPGRRSTEFTPRTLSSYSRASYTAFRLTELKRALNQRARNIVQGKIDPHNPVWDAKAWRERCEETYELILERHKYGELTGEQAARALERERQALGANAHVAWRHLHEQYIHVEQDKQDARSPLKQAVDQALSSYRSASQQLNDVNNPEPSASIQRLHEGARRGTEDFAGEVNNHSNRRDSTSQQKLRNTISQSNRMPQNLQNAPSQRISTSPQIQRDVGKSSNEALTQVPGRPMIQKNKRSPRSLPDANRGSHDSVIAAKHVEPVHNHAPIQTPQNPPSPRHSTPFRRVQHGSRASNVPLTRRLDIPASQRSSGSPERLRSATRQSNEALVRSLDSSTIQNDSTRPEKLNHGPNRSNGTLPESLSIPAIRGKSASFQSVSGQGRRSHNSLIAVPEHDKSAAHYGVLFDSNGKRQYKPSSTSASAETTRQTNSLSSNRPSNSPQGRQQSSTMSRRSPAEITPRHATQGIIPTSDFRSSSRQSFATPHRGPARSLSPVVGSTESASEQARSAATAQLQELINGLQKTLSRCRSLNELNDHWRRAYEDALRVRDSHDDVTSARSRGPVPLQKIAGSWDWIDCEKDMIEAYETIFDELAENARERYRNKIFAVRIDWKGRVKTDQSRKGRQDAAHRGLQQLGGLKGAFERDLRLPSSLEHMSGSQRMTAKMDDVKADLRTQHHNLASGMRADWEAAHMQSKRRFLWKIMPERSSQPGKRSRRALHSQHAYEKHLQKEAAKVEADGRVRKRRISRL